MELYSISVPCLHHALQTRIIESSVLFGDKVMISPRSSGTSSTSDALDDGCAMTYCISRLPQAGDDAVAIVR